MIRSILSKIIGTRNERELKKLQPFLQAVNSFEPEMQKLTDEELKGKTFEFIQRIEKGQNLEEFLPEVFAVVREASKRTLNMRHFDVQVIGAKVLFDGKIAEMKTGEGKTLVATMPAYARALEGKGVHIMTVNDYLAKRDSEWMGKIYRFLGLEVGCIQSGMDDDERKKAYNAHITYGTNNEFGFDYLRDNMKFDLSSCVQREHYYVIVDEVDSILIDEARTPLIISGPSEENTEIYYRVNRIIPKLEAGIDYEVDEKHKNVSLTEAGVAKAEKLLGVKNLYEPTNIDVLHAVQQGIKAHSLFERDVDYIVKDGEVIIVDEFTGRLMPGRRWSDGLHQAIEAKEGVKIEKENQTLATITIQNYIRMYKIKAGMTGTAITEAVEFDKIYNLDVIVIPTHKPMIRVDHPDVIYRSYEEKVQAIIEEIKRLYKKGQPVLVGTISIEKSEHLSKLLRREKIPHVVLNAKYHEREAEIVAQAGRKGSVTIATNMAGRGTDILLGGNPEFLAAKEVHPEENPEKYKKILAEYKEKCAKEHEEVVALGGLFILGTERHEARRIDNQLRGRSGRQGDPGESRFYLSLEDDLMRIFASEKMARFMARYAMKEGQPIESKMVSRAIERAQKHVEMMNFDIRKHLLEYDDVMNKQREAIYELRKGILKGEIGKEYIFEVGKEISDHMIESACPKEKDPEEWDIPQIISKTQYYFNINLAQEEEKLREMGVEEIKEYIWENAKKYYEEKYQKYGEDLVKLHERFIMLRILDYQWKDHLLALDHLKEGIGMRAYGQRDPLVEYKKESFLLFESMMDRIEEGIVLNCFRFEPVEEEELKKAKRPQSYSVFKPKEVNAPQTAPIQAHKAERKIGRNDPCFCGSGKKYKKCHGAK
ncbi:MAG: preprotein translocase subunit SecA [Thermoanaerobaculia bacterium]